MADASGYCFIGRIPIEVLLRISDTLPMDALLNFRLTCRAVEQSLCHSFLAEFFSRKQFMVSNFSLQALIDMAQSRIGPHMRVVQFGTDHFHRGRDRPDIGPGGKYGGLVKEDIVMWDTGSWKNKLDEAFRHLPNLEDVVIRDCDAPVRPGDRYGHSWSSYGVWTVLRETGIRLGQGGSSSRTSPNPPPDIPSLLFAGVVGALARAGSRATGIEVISRWGWYMSPFAFDQPEIEEGYSVPLLRQLEKLYLTLDLLDLPSSRALAQPGNRAPEEVAVGFLSRTPNLRNLRINGRHSSAGPFNRLLELLSRSVPAGCAAAPAPAPVLPPHLEEVSLGIMDVEARALLSLITTLAPTLTSLELWKVRLVRELRADEEEKTPLWPGLLRRLRGVAGLERLRHLKIGMPQQAWADDREPSFVSFGAAKGPAVTYTGPDWRTWLDKEVIPAVEVRWARRAAAMGSDDSEMGTDSDSDTSSEPSSDESE